MKNKLIIGAPFGNYLGHKDCISTRGTFTAARRGGRLYRLWRVIRTVRYYHRIGAWVNRLGLPNPGIGSIGYPVHNSILSVSARCNPDWHYVLRQSVAHHPLAVELNVSCPNCGDEDYTDYGEMFDYARSIEENGGPRIIVKLPPVNYDERLASALFAGLTGFHCCNTLPTPGGGLSGKPLQPLSLDLCCVVRYSLPDDGILIGGGGVTSVDDVRRFRNVGCTNVSIASALFFPWVWRRIPAMVEAFT